MVRFVYICTYRSLHYIRHIARQVPYLNAQMKYIHVYMSDDLEQTVSFHMLYHPAESISDHVHAPCQVGPPSYIYSYHYLHVHVQYIPRRRVSKE